MQNWSEFVRSHLRLIGVTAARETQIVEDLARQLEDAYADAIASGASEADAQARALLHVDDWDRLSRELSTYRALAEPGVTPAGTFASLLSSCRQDLIYGWRLLRRGPTFTLIALAAIALGVGGTTAIFSVFEAVVLRPLPVRDPGALVLFSSDSGEGTSTGEEPSGVWTLFSYANYQAFRAVSLPVDLTAVRSGEGVISARIQSSDPAEAEGRALVHAVAGNFFAVMGTSAFRGRLLSAADDERNAPPVTVLSYGYWTRAFKGDPAVVGRTLILNGRAFTVIGVADAAFFGERVRSVPDAWVPLVAQPFIESAPLLDRKDAYWLTLIGRLQPGATREAAAIAMTTALRSTLTHDAGSSPTEKMQHTIAGSSVAAYDGSRGISGLRLQYSRPLQVLLAAVTMLLLIACANVGTLLVARASVRRAEVSMRMALGASRGRVVRQLLTESSLLAVLGGCAGALVAWWLVKALKVALPLGPLTQPQLDTDVLAFTLAATAVSALVFGLIPAIDSSRTDMLSVLKAGGRGTTSRRRFGTSHGLVLAQIACSAVLLVGAALFARSLVNLEMSPLGFDGKQVLTGRISTRPARLSPSEAAVAYRRLFDAANVIPGVRTASLGAYTPLNGYHSSSSISIEGYDPRPGETVKADSIYISPHYAEMLGMTLVEGRDFTLQDSGGTVTAAIVNQAFVARYFPDGHVLGRRLRMGPNGNDIAIVGVVSDVRFNSPTDAAVPTTFLPIFQQGANTKLDVEIELRADRDPAALTTALRQLASSLDNRLRVSNVETLEHRVHSTFDDQRLTAALVGIFGGLALVLAALGLYGVVAQGVARRTAEFGVRIALGARPVEIVGGVLRETLVLVCVGLVTGIAAALAAARLVAAQLVGVTAGDPSSYVVSAGVLLLVSAAAAFAPALRASRVDPVTALR